MKSLGEYLQDMRKSRDESMESIAAKTRINIVYIQAMENNEWNKIPSEVIARGFVRSYTTSLGLDEKEVLGRFDQMIHPIYQGQEETKQPFLEQMQRVKPQEPRSGRFNRVTFFLIIGFVLTGLFYIGSQNLPNDTKLPVLIESEEVMEAVPGEVPASDIRVEPEAVLTEESFAPEPIKNMPAEETLEAVSNDGDDFPETSEPAMIEEAVINEPSLPRELPEVIRPEPLTLNVEATETTWVAVRIDEGPPREVLLQPGEEVIWVAEDQFILDLGNAGGVFVKFNGKILEPFGPPGGRYQKYSP